MRQAIIFLIAVLAILNAVMAADPLFKDGKYRIFAGNQHVPSMNRYFTGKKDARAGSVTLQPNSTSTKQVWRLRNKSNGRITLESIGNKGYYLSEGRSGALPGAYIGVTKTKQEWGIIRVAGGPFTRYVLIHPRKHNNTELWVSQSQDSGEPKRLALNYDKEGILNGWKFSNVN